MANAQVNLSFLENGRGGFYLLHAGYKFSVRTRYNQQTYCKKSYFSQKIYKRYIKRFLIKDNLHINDRSTQLIKKSGFKFIWYLLIYDFLNLCLPYYVSSDKEIKLQ